MTRLCMRPGCDRGAAARLTYDPVGCQVWLDDLVERVGRNQEICSLHAERLTVPRGWHLADRRSAQAPMFVAPTAPSEPAKPKRRRRRGAEGHPATQTMELFEVLRQELAEAEAEAGAKVEAEAEAEPVVEPEPEPELDTEPEVPEALRATSPLLARAFASTGHQRSVLTQRTPDDGADERS